MSQHWRCRLLAAAAVACSLLAKPAGGTETAGTLCYKDNNPSNPDPYNKYSCEDSSKPNCCQEGDLSTCCDYDPTQRTILQQLTIWGLLLATMVGLVVIYFCCFRTRNNSGTEIRSSEDQQQKSGCRERLGADCCFFLSSSDKKKTSKDSKVYKQTSEL